MGGLPWAVSIEPTTSCNLSCPECPSGLKKFTRPTGNMDIEIYRSIIDQLSPHLIYLTLYFQGEPMLNRYFFEMIKHAKKHRIFVATSTNGHFLNDENARLMVESGLDKLIISLDGIDQETYQKYRVGGNLEIVKQGIANVIKWKKKLGRPHPYVELQFLVLGTNEHQVKQVKEFARATRADKLSLKSAQLYDYSSGNPLLTSFSKFSRYQPVPGGSLTLKSKLPDYCHRIWHSQVITWDGKIVPCCFDKDADHILGDLSKETFAQIRKGPVYRAFREKVFHYRKEVEICSNCSEGL